MPQANNRVVGNTFLVQHGASQVIFGLDSFDTPKAFDEAVGGDKVKRSLRLKLKYTGERRERRPMITGLQRVSKPGRRVYVGKRQIPWVKSGIGVAILSTPKGVMSGSRARQLGVGGEVLCQIW